MEYIGSITISQIVAVLTGILLLISYIKQATEPIKKFNQRIDDIEKHQANDLKRLNDMEDCMHLLLKSNLALLAHGQDNNHTGELKTMEKEIKDYLINIK